MIPAYKLTTLLKKVVVDVIRFCIKFPIDLSFGQYSMEPVVSVML